MDKRKPPATEEGWYALHDCRSIDWDAWRDAPQRVRDRALSEGIGFLDAYEAVEDAEEGQTAVYTVMGHKADVMILHLRPTMEDLDAAERHFEQTEFAAFTEQEFSYVSVTEASGYTEKSREYFEGEVADDSGLAQYIQARLHPDVPDDEFVCFYPMSKRRQPDQNWYDTAFEERAAHIKRHGDIGRGYGGDVSQMIAGSIGFDDWEWGITLWADDMRDIKELLTEMRFDPSTSQYAEFGPFYVGRKFAPADLPAVLAGQRVPTGTAAVDTVPDEGANSEPAAVPHEGPTEAHGDTGAADGRVAASQAPSGDVAGASHAHAGGDTESHGGAHPGSAGEGDHPHTDTSTTGEANHPSESSGGRPDVSADIEEIDDAIQRVGRLGMYEGEAYEAGDYALVFESTADAEALVDDVSDLAESFDHYDRHVRTVVRADSGQTYVVSIWTARDAAETAAGFLSDLPGVDRQLGGPLGDGGGDADDATAAGPSKTICETLEAEGVYAGQPHGEDVFALVVYSAADADTLDEAVTDLRGSFDQYDTHVRTTVYGGRHSDVTAVASLWETEDAAETASEYLQDLPDVVGEHGDRDGFGTMGMFYTVKPEHREDFVAKFDTVADLLDEMDGHRETALLANHDDENDMFIASQWDSKEDAMAFFRSDAFADTVDWGRDVLADRPRHVFLA